jgi:hypothetical protein
MQRRTAIGNPITGRKIVHIVRYGLDYPGSFFPQAGRKLDRIKPGAVIGIDEIHTDSMVPEAGMAWRRRVTNADFFPA